MVNTPGNIRSRDSIAGGEVVRFSSDLQLITSTGVGTFPIFVVPSGEAYRVTGVRIVLTSAIGGTGTETAIAKITDGSSDITTTATGTFTRGTEAIGAAKTPAVVTTGNVDVLAYGDTLSIVTSGTTTGSFLYVCVEMVKVTNNM